MVAVVAGAVGMAFCGIFLVWPISQRDAWAAPVTGLLPKPSPTAGVSPPWSKRLPPLVAAGSPLHFVERRCRSGPPSWRSRGVW